MLTCEGYKMFRGSLEVTPKSDFPAFVETGVFLYRPDTDCWYGNGRSFPAEICTVKSVDGDK